MLFMFHPAVCLTGPPDVVSEDLLKRPRNASRVSQVSLSCLKAKRTTQLEIQQSTWS